MFALWIILLPLLIPVVTAPVGATVCGAVAISQIRRSGGKLSGLGLALADAVLFPLLALDALIGYWLVKMAEMIHFSAIHSDNRVIGILVALPVCAVVDFLIVRWAWRAVNKPLVPGGAQPTPGPASHELQGREQDPRATTEPARQAVKAPAIGMIVAAGINLAVLLSFLGLVIIRTGGNVLPSEGKTLVEPVSFLAVAVAIALGIIGNVVILLGSMSMLQLRNRGLAITAAILALIASPGNIIGLPMGIWALVVLSRREVIEAFAAMKADRRSGSGGSAPVGTSAPPLQEGQRPVESARQAVKAPAIGMIVAAVINAIPALALLCILAFKVATIFQGSRSLSWGVSWLSVIVGFVLLLSIPITIVILLGSMRMMQLRNRGLAITAAILALIAVPGNIIGLPMGIWALVVLCRREVAEAFKASERNGNMGKSRISLWLLLAVIAILTPVAVWAASKAGEAPTTQPATPQVQWREVILPDLDLKDATILDLNSGEMLPMPKPNTHYISHFYNLGRGDLGTADGVLVVLRKGKLLTTDGRPIDSSQRHGDASAYQLESLPKEVIVMTGDGKHFNLRLVGVLPDRSQKIRFAPRIDPASPATQPAGNDSDAILKAARDYLVNPSAATSQPSELTTVSIQARREGKLELLLVQEHQSQKRAGVLATLPDKSLWVVLGKHGYVWQAHGCQVLEPAQVQRLRQQLGVASAPSPATRPTAPQVLKTTPTAFADDVDSATDRITVTFDRPMVDKSWSFTAGDKAFSDKTGSTFPERAGEISYDAGRTTCSMPVKLQPGKVYWVGVNSPQHQSFKSTDGTPARPYEILFATRSADGQPTPLPEDLVKQAKIINTGFIPLLSAELKDNSALDLDAGKVVPIERDWPDTHDVAWDNDIGGVLMIKPKSPKVRIMALPEMTEMSDAAIRKLLEPDMQRLLANSQERGMPGKRSRYAAVLTDRGQLAVVEIVSFERAEAQLRWVVGSPEAFRNRLGPATTRPATQPAPATAGEKDGQ